MLLKGASPLEKEAPPQKAGEDNTEGSTLQEGQSCLQVFSGTMEKQRGTCTWMVAL